MVIKGLEKEMDIEFHLMSDTIIFFGNRTLVIEASFSKLYLIKTERMIDFKKII